MRVVVIGGSGHVGTFLVPRLVEAGHGVVSISRGQREPYQVHPAWQFVEQVTLDREAEEAEGTFGERVLRLEPDVVVDMICFTPESARQLVEALRGRISHFLHCGTIWVHGHSTKVPTTEGQARRPFGEYGVQKARIEAYLLAEARRGGFPATVLHPGHIVGPGWAPVNPAGNFDLTVFERLARGEELALPNLGMETVHHVHADDMAQAFVRSLDSWSVAVGESFHVVSPAALTCVATLRRSPGGSGSWSACASSPGRSGGRVCPRRRLKGHGITLPTVPTAASPKPGACLATSLASVRFGP